ncbi:MAG: SAM-dependent methyltransferase [Candidatus Taylorbacteria bacterium]|nr:SAM-dependent methyltransferase [Candidatus Taylorbacteria bacterium]
MTESKVLITKACKDYELLDSGEGEKLERFGSVVLSRPDPQALWHKNLPEDEWKKRGGNFTRSERQGVWELRDSVPSKWQIEFGGLKFIIKPTAFKHTGIFPEQSPNWEWTKNLIQGTQPEILNLFGYTGGATLACASVGAKVVHVDGSKAAINWAKENAEASGLLDKPIRWILDDAQAFVEREIKRGRKYDGIIMDPPAFGHGPDSELWKIEDHFLNLIDNCMKILSDKPLFFLISGYSAGYSAIAYENNLLPLVQKYGGSIEIGELAIEETSSKRLLPCGIFSRWKA